jgi:hypothetical protein
MAGFTKTNGTMQPVFHMDTANGNIAGTANIAATGSVNFQGPKLDFFSLVANASLISSGNVNGYINNLVQAIQTKATVAMYQVSPAAPTILNLALYPTDAYTAATLLATANTGTPATGGQNIQLTSSAGNAVFTSAASNFAPT